MSALAYDLKQVAATLVTLRNAVEWTIIKRILACRLAAKTRRPILRAIDGRGVVCQLVRWLRSSSSRRRATPRGSPSFRCPAKVTM